MTKPYQRILSETEDVEGYIGRLIAEGEHQQLDFKFGINDSRKIARTLAAFANTDGGRLLIGVKDNGAVAGVRSEEELYMIQAASEMYTRPAVPFEVKDWTVNQKQVLEVIVPKGQQELYYAPEKHDDYKVFVRVRDENFPVNAVWIKAYKWKHSERGIFIRYSPVEQSVVQLLEAEAPCSQSHLCKLGKLRSRDAENILAGFVAIGMVEILFTQQGVRYQLSQEYASMTHDQRLKGLKPYLK